MATAIELNLRPGEPFQHVNRARVLILGVVHDIKPQIGLKAWVEWCSLSADINELFAEGETTFKLDDTGFSRLPKHNLG